MGEHGACSPIGIDEIARRPVARNDVAWLIQFELDNRIDKGVGNGKRRRAHPGNRLTGSDRAEAADHTSWVTRDRCPHSNIVLKAGGQLRSRGYRGLMS